MPWHPYTSTVWLKIDKTVITAKENAYSAMLIHTHPFEFPHCSLRSGCYRHVKNSGRVSGLAPPRNERGFFIFWTQVFCFSPAWPTRLVTEFKHDNALIGRGYSICTDGLRVANSRKAVRPLLRVSPRLFLAPARYQSPPCSHHSFRNSQYRVSHF